MNGVWKEDFLCKQVSKRGDRLRQQRERAFLFSTQSLLMCVPLVHWVKVSCRAESARDPLRQRQPPHRQISLSSPRLCGSCLYLCGINLFWSRILGVTKSIQYALAYAGSSDSLDYTWSPADLDIDVLRLSYSARNSGLWVKCNWSFNLCFNR